MHAQKIQSQDLIPSSRLSLSKRSLIMRSESFLHLCGFGICLDWRAIKSQVPWLNIFNNIQQKCLERWFKIANGFN